jgi:hypothetical protein
MIGSVNRRLPIRTFRPLVHAILIPATVALSTACGSSKQRIEISTVPAGAEVELQRRGTMDIDASIPVAGISGSVDGGSFEDRFITLGNAPVAYEFELDESDARVAVRGQSVGVTKHYREGTIRVRMPGYQTIERLVAFSGSPIELTLTLQPER